MRAIFQTTLSNAFSWMKIYKFRLKFHCSLFLRLTTADRQQIPFQLAAKYDLAHSSIGPGVSRNGTIPLASTLRWRHKGRDGVSNHQPHDCLLNRLFRRRSKKARKLRVTGLCAGNSPGTGEFHAQMASNAENVSISWRHHDLLASCQLRHQPIFYFDKKQLWLLIPILLILMLQMIQW